MSYATFKITNVYSDDVYLQKLKLQAVFMAQFRQQQERGGQGAGGDPPRDQPEAVHRGL